MLNIVLLEPEKPDNCGNIGRTCVCANARLHLIYPLGFQLTKSKINHAGLDYWDILQVIKYDNYDFYSEKTFTKVGNGLDKYNLIAIVVTDAATEVARMLFDGNRMYSSYPYTALEREGRDGLTGRQVVNLISKK